VNVSTRVRAAVAGALLMSVPACFAGGCGAEAPVTTLQASVSTTTTAGTPSTLPTVTTAAGLTLDQVRNAELVLQYNQDPITFALAGGVALNGQSLLGSPGPVEVQAAMSDLVAFGDLDGDGVGDAVIAVGVGRGATSGDAVMEGSSDVTQFIVALLSNGGRPVQAGYHLIGPGAAVTDLSITDATITVAAFVPAPEEPAGRPAGLVTVGLRLPLDPGATGQLLHVGQTSETPAGEVRAIAITSPAPGATVSVPCIIKGTITIAPFENNLELNAYTADLTQRAMAPVMVKSAGLGAPGTFEVTLTLSPPGTSGLIFVTIADRSAVDGSILALASLQLVVK
jgi:hypothetical protein